jgi:hypothetical protein
MVICAICMCANGTIVTDIFVGTVYLAFVVYLVFLVRTPLIRLLLKAMYLYYINIVGRDILLIETYLERDLL